MSFDSSLYYSDQMRSDLEELFRSSDSTTLWIAWGSVGVCVLLAVLCLIAWCRLFIKAGLPWERIFVPFYGEYWQLAIADCGWMFWLLIACAIFAGFLPTLLQSSVPLLVIGAVVLVLGLVYLRKLARAYGRGFWFTVGLVLLHPIFLMILAFGRSEYAGSAAVSRASSRPRPRWTCSCGMENPAGKSTCINCGKPRP